MENRIFFFSIAISFIGGLALFLYGIRVMSGGLKKAAGSRMRVFIERITDNRYTGLLAGALATMMVQSSSTIMVMLVGLVQSNLMTYVQALSIILGAEIGTTAMAQLIAFRIHEYGLPVFAAGFVLNLLSRREGLRNAGEAIYGFGLLLFGMSLMSGAVAQLRSCAPFIDLLRYMENPLYSILAGMLLTALMQSSGAFIGIVITLAQQGTLTLDAGIPMLFGANIGTCITASLASIGMQRPARRVALAQVLFNVTGVAVFLFLIPWYADVVRMLSPSEGLPGTVIPRQIANAHTLYNVFMAVMFLPFIPFWAKLLIRMIPDNPGETRLQPSVWYITNSALSAPSLALSYARAETARMSRILERMAGAILPVFTGSDMARDQVFPELSVAGGIRMREEKVDYLESKVSEYLIAISRQELGERESLEAFALMNIVKDQESMGDSIESLLQKLPEKKREQPFGMTIEGKADLAALHAFVCHEIALLTVAIQEMSARQASNVLHGSSDFLELSSAAESRHLQRLRTLPESAMTHDIHMDILHAFEEMHHYCKSIARSIVHQEAGSQRTGSA
ncbi:MAG: Na/Pi cotransporter family protein [Chlorobiaceae bacterium]|nr:Na/Pi cotransporter family protein [Chlorobiaceae bacterium]